MTINWLAGLGLLVYFGAGIALGAVYFRGLWWNARLFAEGASLAVTIGIGIGRFVLLGSMLTLASFEGAMPLLLVALGVLVARSVVMRSVRKLAV
jgi:F1F0 ATPase subunit 2